MTLKNYALRTNTSSHEMQTQTTCNHRNEFPHERPHTFQQP